MLKHLASELTMDRAIDRVSVICQSAIDKVMINCQLIGYGILANFF